MWSPCARFLPCQREALHPRILAESAPAKMLPGSITGARVQWPAGQKGSCPHRTGLVMAKTGAVCHIRGQPRRWGSGLAALRSCGQAPLNLGGEEPPTGGRCAGPRGRSWCRLVRRAALRVDGGPEGAAAGGCGWRARRAWGWWGGARQGERWSRGREHRVWSRELVHPLPPVSFFAVAWLMDSSGTAVHRLSGSRSACRDQCSHVEADLCPGSPGRLGGLQSVCKCW